VYGDRFVDVPTAEGFEPWSDRLSLDHLPSTVEGSHTVALFQEVSLPDRHLDMQFWFEDLELYDSEDRQIPIDHFNDIREQWWDDLFSSRSH
jgi:hypothetical protein